MAISVSFKVSGSGGSTFTLELEPSTTVQELKSLASIQCSIEAEQMKIIFKGRILKNEDALESLQVAEGSTMHIVKSAPSASAANGAAATTPATTPASPADATTPNAPTPATAALPLSPAASVGGAPLGGMPDLNAMMSDPAMMQSMQQMMGGMGGGGGSPGATPVGAGLGAAGMPGMDMDPAMMSQMLQNPMVQSMMQNLASNPQMLQTMIQSNPLLQNMAQQNPMLQAMLSNPQMLQAMMNPQMLQMVAQMRQGMPGLGAPGAMSQTPAATGTPALGNVEGNPGGATPSAMFNPSMMQAMQAMMGGGMGGGPGVGGVANPTDATPAEQRFATQLDQLSNMGFPDKHSNLQALQTAHGDVNQAINSLLGA
jgi:ubiquilin